MKKILSIALAVIFTFPHLLIAQTKTEKEIKKHVAILLERIEEKAPKDVITLAQQEGKGFFIRWISPDSSSQLTFLLGPRREKILLIDDFIDVDVDGWNERYSSVADEYLYDGIYQKDDSTETKFSKWDKKTKKEFLIIYLKKIKYWLGCSCFD